MELALNLRINDTEVGGAVYQIPAYNIIGSSVRALDDFSRRTTKLLLTSYGSPQDLERYGKTPLFQTIQGYDLYTRDLKQENTRLRRVNYELESKLYTFRQKSMQTFLFRTPTNLIKELKSLRKRVAKLSTHCLRIVPTKSTSRKYYRVYSQDWFGGTNYKGVTYGTDDTDAIRRYHRYNPKFRYLNHLLEEFIPKKYVK